METPGESDPIFSFATLARVAAFLIVAVMVRGALARLVGIE